MRDTYTERMHTGNKIYSGKKIKIKNSGIICQFVVFVKRAGAGEESARASTNIYLFE